jgi:hypothetical protein
MHAVSSIYPLWYDYDARFLVAQSRFNGVHLMHASALPNEDAA